MFDVDSENIIWSLDLIGPVETWAKLSGSAALVWYNSDDNHLAMIRNEQRPLFFRYSKNKEALFYASEDWMITVAAARNKVKLDEEIGARYPKPHHMLTFKWEDNKIIQGGQELIPFINEKIDYQAVGRKVGEEWWEEHKLYRSNGKNGKILIKMDHAKKGGGKNAVVPFIHPAVGRIIGPTSPLKPYATGNQKTNAYLDLTNDGEQVGAVNFMKEKAAVTILPPRPSSGGASSPQSYSLPELSSDPLKREVQLDRKRRKAMKKAAKNKARAKRGGTLVLKKNLSRDAELLAEKHADFYDRYGHKCAMNAAHWLDPDTAFTIDDKHASCEECFAYAEECGLAIHSLIGA